MKRLFIVLVLVLVAVSMGFAKEPDVQGHSAEAVVAANPSSTMWKYIAAAMSVGIACIAGGIAAGQIGAAAMGAMSENPELSGKALPYVGLAEGICLWGFLVALLILVL